MSDPASLALSEIAEAVQASNFERANCIAVQALESGTVHPAFFNVQAMWCERQGRDEDALALYSRAKELAPSDVTILNARGLCLARLSRLEEAIGEFDAAIHHRPDHALSHYRRGRTLWQAGRLEDAETSLKRALSFDAQKSDVLSALAAVVAARGDLGTAASYARRALQGAPNDPVAVSVAAAAEVQSGRSAEAEARLRALLNTPRLADQARITALGLYGRALRDRGRPDESYNAYAERNILLKAQRANTPQTLEQLKNLGQSLASMPARFWRSFEAEKTPIEQRPDAHVFLSGFPRSGMEILANVLGRHKGISLFAGTDVFGDGDFIPVKSAERIAALEGTSVAALRAAYWSTVRKSGLTVSGKVLIDCAPTNVLQLPLIAKLFPGARILFLQRDPRDVIVSWFAEAPRVPPWLGVVDLPTAGELFNEIAKILRTVRDRMPLPIAAVRYETLMADPEASLSAICEFAGLSWERSPFQRFAVREDNAGYDSEPTGMWRVWEDRLAPAMPNLAPWLEEWGYS